MLAVIGEPMILREVFRIKGTLPVIVDKTAAPNP
jgi:hypothetical protein